MISSCHATYVILVKTPRFYRSDKFGYVLKKTCLIEISIVDALISYLMKIIKEVHRLGIALIDIELSILEQINENRWYASVKW